MREFDLNIERVLENWTVPHALREVIANALDEQALTGTPEPQIFEDAEGRWHVRAVPPLRGGRRRRRHSGRHGPAARGRGNARTDLRQRAAGSREDNFLFSYNITSLSHALSDAPDVSLEFEEKLTQELGAVVARQLAAAG